MINKENLIEYLLKEAPEFKKQLELSEPDLKKGEDYTILAEFARYLLGLFKEKKEVQLKKLFTLVDQIFKDGDPYVKNAITIGFLETLQNNVSWEEGIEQKDFLPFLSEALKVEWKNVIDFWEGKMNRDPNVVRTSGRSSNHTTVTNLAPSVANKVFSSPILKSILKKFKK